MGLQTPTICLLFALLLLPGGTGSSKAAELGLAATIPSWGFCSFNNDPYSLDFGSLNPANPVDVTHQINATFRCFGWPSVTFYIGHDAGLHGGDPNSLQMKHATLNEYLHYKISLTPSSGTLPTPFFSSGWRNLTVTGTIKGTDYASAVAGSYSDTVVLTITP